MAKKKTVKERNEKLRPLGKQLKHYGLVLRLYPSKEQINLISCTFGSVRLMYNIYLNERQMYYKDTGKTLSVSKFKTDIMNPAKTLEENSFLKNVDKWFASSKLCSNCGEKKISLSLSEREWVCSACGSAHERDENAAKNIRNEGLKQLNMNVI